MHEILWLPLLKMWLEAIIFRNVVSDVQFLLPVYRGLYRKSNRPIVQGPEEERNGDYHRYIDDMKLQQLTLLTLAMFFGKTSGKGITNRVLRVKA